MGENNRLGCHSKLPRNKRVRGIKGSELIDTVVIDTVTPWWTAHMAKESLSRYAPRPWGMQPNTSLAALLPRFPWALHCSCLCAYYTTFPLYTFYMFYTAIIFSFRVFRGSNLCALCQNMRCEPSWRVFGDRCKAALFRVFSDEPHLQHAVVKEECSRAKWQGCPHIFKAA